MKFYRVKHCGMNENDLHKTYQPYIFYTPFENLPKTLQKVLLENPAQFMECDTGSRYTGGEPASFIRLYDVEINGDVYDLEISLGHFSFDGEYDENTNELPENFDEDECLERMTLELLSYGEWAHGDVYLTRK